MLQLSHDSILKHSSYPLLNLFKIAKLETVVKVGYVERLRMREAFDPRLRYNFRELAKFHIQRRAGLTSDEIDRLLKSFVIHHKLPLSLKPVKALNYNPNDTRNLLLVSLDLHAAIHDLFKMQGELQTGEITNIFVPRPGSDKAVALLNNGLYI